MPFGENSYFWKMKKGIITALFVCSFILVHAQYFQTGQDPAYIRWRQINTLNFQVIYPDYYEEKAKEVVSYLEDAYKYGSYSLNHYPGKIPVILHTQTIKSNGLVAIAPSRAEFYTTPHQSIYPHDWLKQLALHEFRHVVQIDKVKSNLPGIINALLGEQFTGLIIGTYIPWWLIEGDAVVTETVLSRYGRGRFPSFLNEHKAQLVEKGLWSYDKAYLGSYRDFVPNHYKLGYYLVGNVRDKYGTGIWEDVFTETGKIFYNPVLFNKVLKKYTGLKKHELYREVFDSLRSEWMKEDLLYKPEPHEHISPEPKTYTSYNYNHWLNDSEILTYKTSYKSIPAFVRTGINRKEERLHYPGTIFNESVNFADNRIIWSEEVPDPRWHHSGRSRLVMLNSSTKEKIEIRTLLKSFSPAISPDRKAVVVVETDFSNNYYLSVYSLPEGKLISKYQTPGNNYLFSPEWISDDEIAAIILTGEGKRLVRINPEEKITEILSDREMGELKHLRAWNNQLYFISSYSGRNSLYRMNLDNRRIFRIYESRFGVECPAISPDGTKIVLSDYTADGFRLIQIPADHDRVVNIEDIKEGEYPLADRLSAQESGIPRLEKSEEDDFSSERYPKISNLFNFHSRAPFYLDATAFEVLPGVTLLSQNTLGTAEATLGYRWDPTERTGRFLANYSYKGWYPVFDFNVEYGNRASEYRLVRALTDNQGQVIRRDTTLERYTWGETGAGAGVKLPLNLSKGAYYRLLQPEINYDLTSYKHHESTPGEFAEGLYHSSVYRLYFHQYLRQSYQDVYPDFAFIIDGSYRHMLTKGYNNSYLAALQSVLHLPGVLKNHGVKLYGGIQKKESEGWISFNDVVRYARGWGRISTTGICTGGIDYKFPIMYPDINISGLVYLRRITGSLFGDYTRLNGNIYSNGNVNGTFTQDISSYGLEMTADVNFLRFYAPANIGFRASYLHEKNMLTWEMLFSIDFTSL